VLDAVRAVLVGRARRSPVVLVLEDLHWADRATRDLVAYLARTLRSGRVTLAVSYRSDELHRRHPLRPLLAELARLPAVERLELAPFDRAELAEHLAAVSGAPLPAAGLDGIYARSEGNPFYAEQLLAAGGADARVELPPTLAEVLLARVQQLSEPAQQVLRVAAVAGRRVPQRLLARVAGLPEDHLEQGLRAAIGAGVLATDAATGGYASRHALLQEAVYGDLLPGERVRLHAAYAGVLAADPDGTPAELAHHRWASNDTAGALAASVRAAAAAEAVLAPAETLRHLTTALRLWERTPDPAAATGTDRVELALRAAAAASAAGEHEQAVRLAEDAAATADATADPAQLARAHERLGWYLLEAGRVEDALRARARAVELVPAQPPTRLRARVAAAVAQALVHARRREEARRWCAEALAAARGAGSADEEADALITMGMVEQYDDPANARALFAAAQAQAAAAGHPEIELRALYCLAEVGNQLGELASACAGFDQGAALAQRLGLGWSWFGIFMRGGQLRVRYRTGDWDECERLTAAVPEPVTTLAVAEVAAQGLGVLVARGRPAARERLRQLVALAGADPVLDKDVAVWEAELAAWEGDLDRARAAIQRGLAAADAIERFDQVLEGAWVAMNGLTVEAERAHQARAAGDTATLTDATAAGRALLERVRATVAQAHRTGLAHDVHLRARHARAEAEWARLQGRSDPDRWRAAADAFSHGHAYAMARCRWRLAEALLAAGDTDQATAAAQEALDTATRLGAAPLQAALRKLGVRGLARGPGRRPGPTPPTSPRGNWRSWSWSRPASATPTSRGACSSPPRPSTTTSPPSWPSSACGAARTPPPRPAASGWIGPGRERRRDSGPKRSGGIEDGGDDRQPQLVAGAAVPGRGGRCPRGARPRRHPRQPSGPGPRRPGDRRRAGRRVREHRQLHRAARARPSHGPPQRAVRRRPADAVRPLPGRRRDPRRGAGQQAAVPRLRPLTRWDQSRSNTGFSAKYTSR
jgi:tetratricopeptide (TPR) repeat protein